MTKTIATQINELSTAINAIAAAHPHEPTLCVMAWAFEDAANLADGRLRRVLDVPVSEAVNQPPAAPEAKPETEPQRTGRKPKTKGAILNTLRSRPGATSAEIAAAVGCSREYVSTVLSRVAKTGKVRKEGNVGRKGVHWWMEESK